MPETTRKAIILWKMFGRPHGRDGYEALRTSVFQTTDEQILTTLRYLTDWK